MLDQTLIGEILIQSFEQDPKRLNSFSALENNVNQLIHNIGRRILELWLDQNQDHNPSPTTKCRWCGKDSDYISNRAGFICTQFGLIRYQRAYYVCPQCHHSTYPMDERLNPYASLGRLRTLIAAGKSLPVDEMAKAWGLGSLKGISQIRPGMVLNPIVITQPNDLQTDATLLDLF